MLVTVLAIAGAVLGALSIVLHAVAPRTANTYDDRFEEIVDEVLSLLHSEAKPAEVVPTPAK